MSVRVENTPAEIEILNGATIERAEIQLDVLGGDVIRLHVRYRPDLIVNGSGGGTFELWQDEEGNGPGYLALVDEREPLPGGPAG